MSEEWQARSEETIAEVRQRPIKVHVCTLDWTPIENAKVHVEQLRHRFFFGNLISDRFRTRDDDRYTDEQLDKALEEFQVLFSGAVLPNVLKWANFEPEKGEYRFEPAEWAVEWAKMHSIQRKAHVLVWGLEYKDRDYGPGIPKWLYNTDLEGEALWAELERRIRVTLEHFREDVPTWDVVNEALHCHWYDPRLPDYVERSFKLAREIAPEATLLLNEYYVLTGPQLEPFIDQVKGLLDAGTPIDGVGVQVHEWRKRPTLTPDDFYERLDRLAEGTGLPIHISEFGIQTGTELNGREIDDDYQAELYDMVYRVAYGHPAVEAITAWGFWDNMHWRPGSGVLDADLNRKPSFHALHDLIKGEWWTDKTLRTDAGGDVLIDGAAFGDYAVSVSVEDKEMTSQLFIHGPGEGPSKFDINVILS